MSTAVPFPSETGRPHPPPPLAMAVAGVSATATSASPAARDTHRMTEAIGPSSHPFPRHDCEQPWGVPHASTSRSASRGPRAYIPASSCLPGAPRLVGRQRDEPGSVRDNVEMAVPSQMLPLGTKAPEFELPDVTDGRLVSLSDFESRRALLVMFICRH